VRSKSRIYSVQIIDTDIQRDFIEVWVNIEKDIKKYELKHGTQQRVRYKTLNGKAQLSNPPIPLGF
jgi:hypothetical protein